jgi:hypothetical protein
MYESSNGGGTEYCYFIFSSQYYWQPYQLKNLSERTEQTWGYRNNQMKISYKDALRGNWDGIIPVMPGSPIRNGTDHTIPVEPPRQVDSYSGFREGTMVLYRNRTLGEIEKVYSDGSARVDLKRAGDVMVKVEDLAKEVRYYQGFSYDEDVYTASGHKGDINYLFDNGMALIDLNWSRREIIVHISTLRKR